MQRSGEEHLFERRPATRRQRRRREASGPGSAALYQEEPHGLCKTKVGGLQQNNTNHSVVKCQKLNLY